MSETADAVVIGAGIIGASIAWSLARRGLRVTLIDAGRAGGEASWAGAGMLAPGGEVSERNYWSEFAVRSRSLYPDFISELREVTGCPIDFQANGAIEIATTEAEWLALQERAEKQRRLGISSLPVAPSSPELDAVRPARGALFYPGDGLVDPRDVMRALLDACRSRQVRVREQAAVTGLAAGSDSIAVETSTGSLSAAVAVLAAGAWSGAIPFTRAGVSQDLPRSFPVRGHLLGYHPGATLCRAILRHGDTYIVQRSNGYLIAGASTENAGFDRQVDPEIVRDLARRAEELLPCLRQVGTPEAWLGFRPRAEAHQPRIGRFAASNLWLAYGHYRNGILLAPATAERVSAEIMSTSEMGLSSPAGNR